MADEATVLSVGGKRARSKAANRKAILEAARRVFSRIGYGATTVRDIIRETNLAAGTFYNYFKSKEEVFEALSDDSAARFRPVLKRVRDEADGFEDFIAGAYLAYFEFIYAENAEAIADTERQPRVLGVRVDTPEMQTVFEELRADMDELIQRGEAPKMDVGYLTAAAMGIARDIGDRMLARRPVDPEGAATFATALLIGGLSALPAN